MRKALSLLLVLVMVAVSVPVAVSEAEQKISFGDIMQDGMSGVELFKNTNTDGGAISIGGTAYEKGITMRLTDTTGDVHYDLRDTCAKDFSAELYETGGTVRTYIYADSELIFDSGDLASDQKKSIYVSVAGKRDLMLRICGDVSAVSTFANAEITTDETLAKGTEGKIETEKLASKNTNGTLSCGKALSGKKLSLAGREYSSGIQLAPDSGMASVTYSVENMKAESFYACVGKDDCAGNTLPVIFKVYADANIIAQTPELITGQYCHINAPIPAGTKTVTLEAVWQEQDNSPVNFCDAGFMYTASASHDGVVYLSDMTDLYHKHLLGDLVLDSRLDKNGPISIEGQTFEKGISMHPMLDGPAWVVYDITNSGAKTFSTYVGQCDSANGDGDGVECLIYVDNILQYDRTFQYDTPAEHVELDISGASQIVLKIAPGATPSCDSFSFGDAKLILNSEKPEQYLSYGTVNLTEYKWKSALSITGDPNINTALQDTKPLVVGGKQFDTGFSLHPVNTAQPAYIEYDISSFNAEKFTVKVGKTLETSWSDPNPNFTVNFKIYTDGILAAECPKTVFGEFLTMTVDVTGVTTLRLEVDGERDITCDASAFCDPTLYFPTGKGQIHIKSPYVIDSTYLQKEDLIEITGNAPSADEIKTTINGIEKDIDAVIDGNGNFKINIDQFERSYNKITLNSYISGQKISENSIYLTLAVGNVLNLYQFARKSVSTNGEIFYGVGGYNNNTLSIGGGALTTKNGFCVHPDSGAANSAGSFDVVYDLTDYQNYSYFEVTVGRDDRARITGGANRGNAMCYILCDDKIVAQTSDVIGAGEYELLSCNIPEGTKTLTLRTSNSDGNNYADYIDWFEPVICKNKELFYRTEQTIFTGVGAKTASPLYSTAVRFNAKTLFKAVSFNVKPIDKTAGVTAKLYRFLYSEKRSVQEEAIVENTLTPDAGGKYTLETLTECSEGEYLLVLENVSQIQYTPSDNGAVYIDGECINGFADISVCFTMLTGDYFGEVSSEGAVYTSASATDAENERAENTIEGYLSDLSTFPATYSIGDKTYTGFDADFTETDRKVTSDDKRETTVVTLAHTSGLVFELTVVSYPEYAAFDWVVNFSNPTDQDSPIVSNFNIADIDLNGEDPYFTTSYGETPYITPYIPLNYHLSDGDTYFYDANTGRSSEEDSWPYFNLEYGNKGAFVAVGWSAWWQTTFKYNDGTLNLEASQSTLNSYLKPGENFRTPLMAFVLYDGRDLDRATNLWRRWFIDCNMHTKDGELFEPGVAAATGWYTHEMLNTTEEMQKSIMQTIIDSGISLDYWWMDAGWYVLPDYAWDNASPWLFTGNWDVDTERFPTSLKSISDLAEENGIETILWFEPERVGLYVKDLETLSQQSDSVIKPEWLLAIDENREAVDSWSPFNVLDIGNEECLEWLINQVTKVLVNADISIYREDFNVAPVFGYIFQDGGGVGATDRSGSTENKCVQAHLKYWDAILALDKIKTVDSCASGGHRLDLESMRRAVALHPADYDYSDQVAKQVMTYTIGQWLPYFGTNTGYDLLNASTYDVRSSFHPFLALTYNFSSSSFGSDDVEIVKDAVDDFNSIKQYYYNDLYQLTDWNISPDKWYSYEYFDPDTDSGYAMVYRRDGELAPDKQYIKLKGLNTDGLYRISLNDAGTAVVLTGKEAMQKGVSLTLGTANSSEIVRITSIDTADYEKVKAVEDLISAIGAVTLDSTTAIEKARDSYNALTDTLKVLVSNEQTLKDAESMLVDLKAAKTVEDMISALPDADKVSNSDKAKVTAAREAFNELSDAQKALVPNEQKLISIEDVLKIAYGDINGTGGITASDALLALQASVKKITLTDEQIIIANVDGAGGVTATDALLILQRSVNKIQSFPVEAK